MTNEEIKREAEKRSREVAQDWYDRIRPTVSPGEFKALERSIENALSETSIRVRDAERERCATIVKGWMGTNCTQPHEDDPCCHARLASTIYDLIIEESDGTTNQN